MITNVTKKMTCGKCGYHWETRSQMLFVTCPSCRKLINTAKEVAKT